MVILRAFEALVAGFALMTILLSLARSLLARQVPGWAEPTVRGRPGAVLIHLGLSFLAAVAGGYVTAWIGADDPLGDALVLGIAALALGGISALATRGSRPILDQLLLVAVAPIGVLAGGLVRLRVLGLN